MCFHPPSLAFLLSVPILLVGSGFAIDHMVRSYHWKAKKDRLKVQGCNDAAHLPEGYELPDCGPAPTFGYGKQLTLIGGFVLLIIGGFGTSSTCVPVGKSFSTVVSQLNELNNYSAAHPDSPPPR